MSSMSPAFTLALVALLTIGTPFAARAVAPGLCRPADTASKSGARNDEMSSRTRFLVFDLSPAANKRETANRIFTFAATDDEPVVQKLKSALLAMRNSPPNSNDYACMASPVIELLRDRADYLAAHSTRRWIASRGDNIQVFLLRAAGSPAKIEIKEEARQTRLSSDLIVLAKLAQKVAVAGGPTALAQALDDIEPYSFTFQEYYLFKPRATLHVAGLLVPTAATAGKTGTANADTTDSSSRLSTTLITGPAEHFFLSANVAFSKLHQIRFDDATQALTPVARPKEFLVGFDYTYGDILDDANKSGASSFFDGLVLGLMLEGSSRPFNQVALTLGFRHLPGFAKFVTFDAVSPYVGFVWARNDKLTGSAGSAVVDSKYGKPNYVGGLSLNLDKALGWVSGGQ